MNLINRIMGKRPKLGLALSGGATHGAAHIGILQVLEREGIRPDFVAGTSAGALVGAAYCAGVPLDELEKLFLSIAWPTFIKFSLIKPLALFDTQPMEEFIRKNIGDCEFKDLNLPFAAISCDIVTGERVVLDEGLVAPCVRASAAIPGLFSPVEINGRLLVDGGVVDNLPVEHVRDMGADFTIGCDVSSPSKRGKRPENPFESLLAMVYIMQERSTSLNQDMCDCLIKPNISQYSAWGFGDSDKMIEEGRISAEAALPHL
ncbi:MAG: patatin-like phospholipase family protein, partial [Anaerolineaceae bacterium]|nr:patatin-like phospholipase family protein [Anaerolineaceae bacterium]